MNNEPQRGDVVVGKFKDLDKVVAIKRVVGLPTEWVLVEDGQTRVGNSKEGPHQVLRLVDTETYASAIAQDYSYRPDPFEHFLIGIMILVVLIPGI